MEKKTNVYHLIVVDESGSMRVVRNQTISGCNETIQSIRTIQEEQKETQVHYVTLVFFDSSNVNRVLFDRTPIENVREVTMDDYCPNACTPLYDAMGISIGNLRKNIVEGGDNTVLVTVITDGLENSSREFSAADISALVKEQQEKGWTFAYIGANQNEVLEAGKIGIENSLAWEQSARGTKQMFCSYASSMKGYCGSITPGEAKRRSMKKGFFDKVKGKN